MKIFKTKNGRITIIPGFFDGEYFDISNKRSPMVWYQHLENVTQ